MPRAVHEEPIAALAAAHLQRQGIWELFSEVKIDDGVCDLVAKHTDSGIFLIGECKAKRIGWQVLKQAMRRRQYGNYVVIFTPANQDHEDEEAAIEIARAVRVGWTVVSTSSGKVKELVPAPPLRSEVGDIGHYLRDEHRWWAAAGNARGERFTIARKSARDFAAFVTDHPRCTLEEVFDAGVTHYRSAKEARVLVKLCRTQKIPGVAAKYDGVTYRFYRDDEPAAEAQRA